MIAFAVVTEVDVVNVVEREEEVVVVVGRFALEAVDAVDVKVQLEEVQLEVQVQTVFDPCLVSVDSPVVIVEFPEVKHKDKARHILSALVAQEQEEDGHS